MLPIVAVPLFLVVSTLIALAPALVAVHVCDPRRLRSVAWVPGEEAACVQEARPGIFVGQVFSGAVDQSLQLLLQVLGVAVDAGIVGCMGVVIWLRR